MIGDDSGNPHVLTMAGKIGEVTLVIPGRNCAATLDRCLQSVVPLKQSGELKEIIFVDDGSTDTTPEIAARYPVRVITGGGQGPGAARNLGWRAAQSELIWFIDSDCVAHPDALQQLLPHLSEPEVAGAGGSYSNLFPESLLATLIHEEIVARHRRMPREVDFLATFNVVYRRCVLQVTQGFNETLKLAQDAEFAYRIRGAGHRLRFAIESRVGHHHPRQLWRYLKTQARQGYYRVQLYRQHPTKISGDSYAGWIDYGQPPLACMSCLLLLIAPFSKIGLVSLVAVLAVLVLVQIPWLIRAFPIMRLRSLGYVPFGVVRAFARGIGMSSSALALGRNEPKQNVESGTAANV